MDPVTQKTIYIKRVVVVTFFILLANEIKTLTIQKDRRPVHKRLLHFQSILNIKRVDAIKLWFTTSNTPLLIQPSNPSHATHQLRHTLSLKHMHTKSYKYTVHSTPTWVRIYLQYQKTQPTSASTKNAHAYALSCFR